MSRDSATVKVWCDGKECKECEEIELTALARYGSWDERNVNRELEDMGWYVDEENDIYYCPDCADEYSDEIGF